MTNNEKALELVQKCLDDWPYAATRVFDIMKRLEQVKVLLREQPEQKHGHWISVKDRLPDVEGDYLAWEIAGFAFVDTFKDGEWATGSSCLSVITHWMPLPEPPEEVKQE